MKAPTACKPGSGAPGASPARGRSPAPAGRVAASWDPTRKAAVAGVKRRHPVVPAVCGVRAALAGAAGRSLDQQVCSGGAEGDTGDASTGEGFINAARPEAKQVSL